MRRPNPSSPHWKAAQRAIARRLDGEKAPVLLFDLTSTAESAARGHGRKTELFPSLFDYVELLPANWSTSWIGGEGQGATGDRLYYAVPRGWTRETVSPSGAALLLGSREAHAVSSPDA